MRDRHRQLTALLSTLVVLGMIAWPLSASHLPMKNAQIFRQTNQVTVGNSNTEGTLLGTGVGSLTIPANALGVGTTVRLRLSGYHSHTGTPTLRIRCKIGSTTVLDSTAITLGLTGVSANHVFQADFVFTCRTTGNPGTVYAQGTYRYMTSGVASSSVDFVATSTSSIDTTSAETIDFTVQWGTTNAANTITCTNATLTLEQL